MIEAWFDGVCEPINPGGSAAWGALVKHDGEVVFAEGGFVGSGATMSNNVAEYSAVCVVFEQISQLPKEPATIHGDSMLVINQLRGTFDVYGGLYLPYYRKAMALYAPLRGRVTLDWIPRDKNSECDVLSKKVLLDRGIKFRIQPETPKARIWPR